MTDRPLPLPVIDRRWIIPAALSIVALYFINPSTSVLLPPCLFHKATGLYCPGCGTLRAIYNLIHLDFTAAFAYNPLSVSIITAFTAYFVLYMAYKSTGINLIFEVKWLYPAEGYILLSIIVLFWIARNLPYYPFMYLAPQGP